MEQEEDDHENYQRDGKLRDVGDDHGDGKAIEKTPEKSDEEELEEGREKERLSQGLSSPKDLFPGRQNRIERKILLFRIRRRDEVFLVDLFHCRFLA